MSGGAFDYLCHRDASDLFRDDQIDHMVVALVECGHIAKRVTERTQALAAMRKQIDDEIARLAPVWRAVEWHHSGDVGVDRIYYEIGKLESS